MKLGIVMLLASLAVVAGGGRVLACNVPVFRYALERWPADPFWLMTPATPTNLIAALQSSPINLNVETGAVEVASLFAPEADPEQPPLWKGEFTPDAIRPLVDSPARRELVRRMQEGASAVWVLIESGDAKADAAAAQMLETNLTKLAAELKVPEVDPDDPRTADNVKLKIQFASVRIPRSAPAEQFFIQSLLSGDIEAGKIKGPVVVPVFGQGRALAVLAGEDLSPERIEEAAVFLCGACSCEVKSMNPGWDLLIAADWGAMVDEPVVKDPELPPLISLSTMATPAAPASAPVLEPVVPVEAGRGLSRNLIFVVAALLGVAAVGTLLVRRKP